MSKKPTNIDTLLVKLKAHTSPGCSTNIAKINKLCDTFIADLQENGVDINHFNISISIGENTINIGQKNITPTKKKEIMSEKTPEITENCLICYSPLDEITTAIKCGHKFHRDCILSWYQDQAVNDACSGNKIPRSCPYCRSDGGYLDLYVGEKFIKTVHFDKYETEPPIEPAVYVPVTNSEISADVSADVSTEGNLIVIDNNLETKNKDDDNKCIGKTKKGKNCKNSKVTGTLYCYKHQPDYSTKKDK